MKDILALFGLLCMIGSIIVIGVLMLAYISDLIDILKCRHKYKHRFDKSPTAKCYCVDCEYYNNETEWCGSFKRCFGDSGFCCLAKPRKKE